MRNDGALKAFPAPQRPLHEACESGSCGAPCLCLHRAIRLSSGPGRRKWRYCLISRENVTPAQLPVRRHAAPHYCIARGKELWFERLDFDAF